MSETEAGGVSRPLAGRALAEAVGTAFLLVGVVGSGIMAERLSPDDTGLQLLENALATAGVLVALILALGPASGAHLNPVVTLADRFFGGLTTREAAAYLVAQLTGAVGGVVVANLMFDLPAVEMASKVRDGGHLSLSEAVATFGLLVVIFGVVRSGRAAVAAFAVGGYIGGAYFFTSSTSFANPAVTLARTLTDTFTGIDPASVLPFLGGQTVGLLAAIAIIRAIYPDIEQVADRVVVPHTTSS